MRLNYTLKEYFYFKKHERRGLIIISITAAFFAVLPVFYPLFFPSDKADFSKFKEKIAFFIDEESPLAFSNTRGVASDISYFKFNPNTATEADLLRLGISPKAVRSIVNYRNKGGKFYNKADLKKIYNLKAATYEHLVSYIDIPQNVDKQKKFVDYSESEKLIAELFLFNPNEADYEDLVRLGIPPRTAKGLLKYRNAGAVFRVKSDLQKVYNFREEDYKRLESFIDLPDTSMPKAQLVKQEKNRAREYKQVIIDVNKASNEDWQQLRGIGPSYSKRIVNFREKLGGFATIEQVGETYNLPDSVFQAIKPFLTVSSLPTQIAINEIDETALAGHPLFRWKEAKRIIAFRQQHGNFDSMDSFRKIPAFSEHFFDKTEPYLSFQ